MKSPFIRELKADEIATAVFLVHSKEIRQKRTGEPYLSLLLGDRSGEIDARMWDNVAEVMSTFERDHFIKVKGLVQIYNNRTQLTIHKLRRVADDEVDFRDFFAASKRDPDAEMWRSFAPPSRLLVTRICAICSTRFSTTRRSRRAIVWLRPRRAFITRFAADYSSMCFRCAGSRS